MQVNAALEAVSAVMATNYVRFLHWTEAAQILITPDLTALARAGVSVREFSAAVDVFNDGANVTQALIDGQLVNLRCQDRMPKTLRLANYRIFQL